MPPPSVQSVSQDDESHILPPDRAVEPYTIESWFSAIRGTFGGTMVSRQYRQYAGTKGVSPLDTYTPMNYVEPFWMQLYGQDFGNFAVCVQISMVDCPKEWYEPTCSPMSDQVDPRDVCLQSTLWPIQDQGFPTTASARGHASGGDSERCPDKPVMENASINFI